MTEVPEHLLQRSQARRAALGLGGDDGGIAAAAAPKAAAAVEKAADTGAAPAPAAAAAAAPPAPPAPPEPAFVAAGRRRNKIPVWAMPVLVFLPIWAILYVGTLDKETPKTEGPRALGASIYSSKGCAGCHGGGGGGGSGPALTTVTKTFTKPADQLYWVMEGTSGFKAKGLATYGDTKKPVGGGGVMPAWADALKAEELIGVVRHERESFGGEKFTPTEYDDMLAMIKKEFPAREAEFKEAIDVYKTMSADA